MPEVPIATRALSGRLTTDEERDTILKMLEDGLSVREIARKTGRSRRTIDNIKNRFVPDSSSLWTDEESTKCLSMFQDGFTAREIGDTLGKSRMAVNSRLWRRRPKPIPIEEEDELTRLWSLATFKTAS